MTPARFKQIRRALGLTQIEMAERIGYKAKAGRNNISDFESGRREPPPWIAQLVEFYAGEV